jgi:hypothetical protein
MNDDKYIELRCECCGKVFSRLKKEHKRNTKKGRKVYCSIACHAKAGNNFGPYAGKFNFNLKQGRERDEYSSFKYYLNKAKQRKKYGVTDLTLAYLKKLWEDQGGICPYTKLKMILPETTAVKDVKVSGLNWASLDRIDSSKGYVQGNVEFVCIFINFAKNKYEKDTIINFLSQLKAA